MFRNKHVITAMLVAPLLAILTWFAVGALVGEKPKPAQRGQSYPLVETSSCRYASGVCELTNNDLRLTLRAGDGVGFNLTLTSTHALDQVQMAVGAADSDTAPRLMMRGGDEGRSWYLPMSSAPAEGLRIRLVASRAGSAFFADASTAFLQTGDRAR